MVPEWAKSRVGSSASWLGEGGGEVTEVCPGCEEEVRFGDLELGVCREGHVFGESSSSLPLSLRPAQQALTLFGHRFWVQTAVPSA